MVGVLIPLVIWLGNVMTTVQAQNSTLTPPWAIDPAQTTARKLLFERLTPLATDVAAEEISDFVDEAAASPPNAVLRLHHVIQQLGWSRTLNLLPHWDADTSLQFEAVQLSGTAVAVRRIELDAVQSSWFDASGTNNYLYEVILETAPRESLAQTTAGIRETDESHHVYCRSLPTGWLATRELLQPATFDGLKVTSRSRVASSAERRELCVLADVPRWLLDARDASTLVPSVPEHLVALGREGWDLCWVDMLAARNQSSLRGDEAAAFFSLMRIAPRVNLAGLHSSKDPREVLGEANKKIGVPVQWNVRLVSGKLIEVPERMNLLGAERYIQFDGLVDIGRGRIMYEVAVATPGDSQFGSVPAKKRVPFEGEFPVTIVTSDLAFIPREAVRENRTVWTEGRYIQLQGIFYRLWSYQSELLKEQGSTARQAAPLIVAQKMEPAVPTIAPDSAPIGLFGVLLSATTLCILGTILYLAFRKEPRRRSMAHRFSGIPDQQSAREL